MGVIVIGALVDGLSRELGDNMEMGGLSREETKEEREIEREREREITFSCLYFLSFICFWCRLLIAFNYLVPHWLFPKIELL